MEFKFRAVEDRPPPIYSPGPGYFSDQRFRGGYGISPLPSDYRGGYGISPPPTDNQGAYPYVQPPSDYPGVYGFGPIVSDYRELVQREIEKARIREEIIAMEMERRRLMEAEARRLMMERDMVLPEFGLPFEDRLTMQFNQRPAFTPHPFDCRFIQDHPSTYPGHGSFNMLPAPPLQHQPQPEASKEKIIFLPKPQPRPDLSGIKRKAVTPPVPTKKKHKEEWSCALCQVSATSQKGLNHHLKGKKHKGKEARLQAEKAAKHSNRKQLPKKTIVPKPAGATPLQEVTWATEPGVKSITNSFPVETNDKDFVQKIKDPHENKAEELSEPITHQPQPEANKGKIIFLTDLSGRKRKTVTQPLVPTQSKKKPKGEWSCALCQVSATSRKALNHHLKGKKHKGREERIQAGKAAKHSNREQLPEETFEPKPSGTIEELSSQNNQNADHMKEKDGEAMAIKKLKSWCEICKTGPHSEKVMKAHKKGKKHMAQLKKMGLNETVTVGTTPETTQEEEDAIIP